MNDFSVLAQHRAEPSISLAMPVDSEHVHSMQNRRLLKFLLAAARRQAVERGHEWSSTGAAVTRLAWAALQDAKRGGMVLLHSPRHQYVYRLATQVRPQVTVDTRFAMRPLVSSLDSPAPHYTLILDPEHVELYESGCGGLRPVSGVVLPRSLKEAVALATPSSASRVAGGMQVIKTCLSRYAKSESALRQFLRAIDGRLRMLLRSPGAALVLCASPRVRELFLQCTAHRDVIIAELPLPEAHDLPSIQQHVRVPAERHWAARRAAAIRSLPDLRRAGRLRAGLDQVLPAADEGRVDSLFIAAGCRCWGRYDPRQRVLKRDGERTSSNQDLLDLAAVRTAVQGGSVMFVEGEHLPSEAVVMALMRY